MLRAVSPDPVARSAWRAVAVDTGLILGAALVGAAIRLLPWALDPTIAWSTLKPFAKSLGAVAVEAALLTGWPVGWAVAAQRLVERGEALVLATLGEAPWRTLVRLSPQTAVLALALGAASLVLGRDSAAPGRVVNALIAEGRGACTRTRSSAGTTQSTPFIGATWLCPPEGVSRPPHLVGRAPLGNVVFSARAARTSDDLRRIELRGAHLLAGRVRIDVGTLTLKGLAPWSRASVVPPIERALIVVLSALFSAALSLYTLLSLSARGGRHRVGARPRRPTRFGLVTATALGAAGPLITITLLRALELRAPEGAGAGGVGEGRLPFVWELAFAVLPLVAAGVVLIAANVLARLPGGRVAGTT